MNDYILPSSDDESAELDRILEKMHSNKTNVASVGDDFGSSSDDDDDDSLSSSDLETLLTKQEKENQQEMLPNKTNDKEFHRENHSPDRFLPSGTSSTDNSTADESPAMIDHLLTPLDDNALEGSSKTKTIKHASPKRIAHRDSIFSSTSSEDSLAPMDEAELARVAQQAEQTMTSPGFSTSTEDSAVFPPIKQTTGPSSSSWSDDDSFPFDEAELVSVVQAAEKTAAATKSSLDSSAMTQVPTPKQTQKSIPSSSLLDDSFPFMDEAELLSVVQEAETRSATKNTNENTTSPFFATTSNESTPTRSNKTRVVDDPSSHESKNSAIQDDDKSVRSHSNPYRTTTSTIKSPPNPIVTASFPDTDSETHTLMRSPNGLGSFDHSKATSMTQLSSAQKVEATAMDSTLPSKRVPFNDRVSAGRPSKRPRNVHYSEDEANAFGFGAESIPEVHPHPRVSETRPPHRSYVNILSSNSQDEAAFGFDSEPLDRKAPNLPSQSLDAFDASGPEGNASQDDATDNRGEVIQGPLIDSEARMPEVQPCFYAPPPHQTKSEPMVHYFSATNRPATTRRQINVSQVFESPVNSLWKSKFDTFNQLQSEMANTLAYSDDNVVVSAPTGAGKTAVFEMAMARFFAVDLQANGGNRAGRTQQISKNRKIVYVSPSKALCEERFDDWSTRLAAMNLGIEVVLVTGDGDPSESFRDLASGHVILTTPEKWDSLTRRWTENFYLFGTVKLFLVDEVHLLADESRGCCLESIVCRMKSIQRAACQVHVTQADIDVSSYANTTPEAFRSPMRLVAVSATLPNISEIAAFLEANEAHVFDQSYRPVPLTIHVIGQGFIGKASNAQFQFWRGLDREVPPIIHKFSKQRPTIVFCHSKAETERLADVLATANGIAIRDGSNSNIASQARARNLQRALVYGVAYHHAGLDLDDRRLVENAFASGKIRALCATSTLAMGVNLPAHLVVIRGTRAWRGGAGYQDLDQATLLQMIGRAGRPGYDTSGTAVIMTDNQSKQTYERLATSGLEPAKSRLLSKLDEIMNSEISQRVITSTESALNWMKGTLFYRQLTKDPVGHNVQVVSAHSIDTHLLQVCAGTVQRLQTIGALIKNDGQALDPLEASHIMSQHLVDYNAMTLVVKLPFDASQCQVLKAICAMEGLHRPVRRCEKKKLNAMHKSIKYKLEGPPSKVRVQQPEEKAFVLIQASIGQIYLEDKEDNTLRRETTQTSEYASRMLAAAEEYSARGSKHGQVILQSLKLRRSIATSLWTTNDGVLRQFNNLSQETVIGLKFNGISTFEDVMASTEEAIEKAAKRSPPFGANLRSAVSKVLQSTLKVSAEVQYASGSTTPSHISCRLSRRGDINADGQPREILTNRSTVVKYTLVAYTDRPGGCLIYQKNVSSPGSYEVACPPKFGKISIHLIASMVGLDDKVELEGNDVIQPSTFSSATNSKAAGAKRKVRGTNTKTGNEVTARFKSGLKYVQDPRLRRTTTSKRLKTETASQETTNLRKKPKQMKPSVTPSPKPGPSNCSEQTDSDVRSPRDSSQSTMETFFRPNANQISTSGMCTDRKRGSVDSSSATPAIARRESSANTFSTASSSRFANAVGNIVRSVQGTSHQAPQVPYNPIGPGPHTFKARSDTGQTKESARNWSAGKTSWNQARREQHRAQQRAFVHKKDNPFSRYKHDPNDAESYLENLSTQNTERSPQSSVIPPAGLRALADAYKDMPTFVPRRTNGGANSRGQHTNSRPRGRRQFPTSRVSTQALLAQKAEEQNAYAQHPAAGPTQNWDSYTYPASEGPVPYAPHQYYDDTTTIASSGAYSYSYCGSSPPPASEQYSSRYFAQQPAFTGFRDAEVPFRHELNDQYDGLSQGRRTFHQDHFGQESGQFLNQERNGSDFAPHPLEDIHQHPPNPAENSQPRRVLGAGRAKSIDMYRRQDGGMNERDIEAAFF